MKTVLVTGSEGFIGKNLVERLKRLSDLQLLCYDIGIDEGKVHKRRETTKGIRSTRVPCRPETLLFGTYAWPVMGPD